ncbi:hypothetical protein D3C78_1614640 [compost metagenome]
MAASQRRQDQAAHLGDGGLRGTHAQRSHVVMRIASELRTGRQRAFQVRTLQDDAVDRILEARTIGEHAPNRSQIARRLMHEADTLRLPSFGQRLLEKAVHHRDRQVHRLPRR